MEQLSFEDALWGEPTQIVPVSASEAEADPVPDVEEDLTVSRMIEEDEALFQQVLALVVSCMERATRWQREGHIDRSLWWASLGTYLLDARRKAVDTADGGKESA